MRINKKTIVSTIFLIAISFFAICFFVGFKYNKHQNINLELKLLNNQLVYNIDTDFDANNYELIIYDENNEEIKTIKTNQKFGNLDIELKYLDNISVEVKTNKHQKIINSDLVSYTSLVPSFNSNNSFYLTNDYGVLIDGNVDNYRLIAKYNNDIIYETKASNTTNIPYEKFKNYMGRINFYLIDENNQIIDTQNFYVNTTLVGSIKIINPLTESIPYKDFTFTYDGGVNATNIELQIYKGKKVIKIIKLLKEESTISIKDLKPNTSYTLKVVAKYNDYEEIASTDKIKITTMEKTGVKLVYTTTDYQSLKANTPLSLYTNTVEAKILYTTDGSNPLKGKMYTGPLFFTKDTTLKTIAIKNGMANSKVVTFNVKVKDKVPVIYLSPSNQSKNYGVKSVGYTNEREMMNKVADVVERTLKKAGVIVYRNDPKKHMDTWLSESNKYGADLHLAIHSNGSISHKIRGVEIYIHDDSSLTYGIAQSIYNDLISFYPNKEYGRGVLYAEGRMGEVNPLNTKVGVLLEIAYHDQKDDAKWIVNNLEKIGISIANSVLKYFQVK